MKIRSIILLWQYYKYLLALWLTFLCCGVQAEWHLLTPSCRYSVRVSPQMANRIVDSARSILNKFLPDIYIYTDHTWKASTLGSKCSAFGEPNSAASLSIFHPPGLWLKLSCQLWGWAARGRMIHIFFPSDLLPLSPPSIFWAPITWKASPCPVLGDEGLKYQPQGIKTVINKSASSFKSHLHSVPTKK